MQHPNPPRTLWEHLVHELSQSLETWELDLFERFWPLFYPFIWPIRITWSILTFPFRLTFATFRGFMYWMYQIR